MRTGKPKVDMVVADKERVQFLALSRCRSLPVALVQREVCLGQWPLVIVVHANARKGLYRHIAGSAGLAARNLPDIHRLG